MKKILFIIFMLTLFPFSSKAELMIDVNGAMRDPMPIAIAEMVSNGFSAGNYGEKIRDVVVADL